MYFQSFNDPSDPLILVDLVILLIMILARLHEFYTSTVLPTGKLCTTINTDTTVLCCGGCGCDESNPMC
jgi:hypothetical protein